VSGRGIGGRSPLAVTRPAHGTCSDGGRPRDLTTLAHVTDLRALVTGRARAVRRGTGRAWRATSVVLAPVARRGPEIVLGLALVLSTLAVLVLVGAARNDAAITGDRGVAVGEVLDGSDAAHTFIRYTASDGAVLSPDTGVLYPRGLQPGNYVLVEYDRGKPELVRVAGRDWIEGLAPVALGVAGLWVVLGPLTWYLARRRRAGQPDDAAGSAPDPTTPLGEAAGEGIPPDEGARREPVGASR
jgi:hypothetical protein